MVLYRDVIKTPIGPLTLLSTPKGLCRVDFSRGAGQRVDRYIKKHFPDSEIKKGGEHNRKAAKQILAYLQGKLKRFSVKLDVHEAGFNRKVLGHVKGIPFGKTRTYGRIAAALGKPGAARAVGNANRLNPIPIIIPCHRVVAANGLGGYGGGLALKVKLLKIEGADIGKTSAARRR